MSDHGTIPPEWVVKQYGSARKWRADVRRRMRLLEIAAQDASRGSAFYPKPAPGIASQLREAAKELRQLVSVKNWEGGGTP